MVHYLCNPIRKFLTFIVISSIAIGTFSTIDLLFLIEKSLTFQTIAFLAILLNIAIFILEIPTGIISDRITPIKALIIGTIFRATASFFYILDFKYHLYFATLFAAIGIAFLSGSMNSAIINMSELNRSNEKLLSYLNFYKSVGLMIGGIIGYKTFSLNIQYPWIISACLSILSCVFLLNINSFKKNQISRDYKKPINYLVAYKQLLSKPIFWCVVFFATSAVAPTMLWQLLFKEYQNGVIIGYVLLQSAALFSSRVMINIELSQYMKIVIMCTNLLCIVFLPLFKDQIIILSLLLFIHVCLHIMQSICVYASFHREVISELRSSSESIASAFDSIIITLSYFVIGWLMDQGLLFFAFAISGCNSLITLLLFLKSKH